MDLAVRRTLVMDWRVVESADPVNYQIVGNVVSPIDPHP
jgi:hypothetical protein